MEAVMNVVEFVGVKGALFLAAGFALDRWAVPMVAAGFSKAAAFLKPKDAAAKE